MFLLFTAKKELEIPYKITAITPETGETCIENGILSINKAFEAQISGGDYKDKKMTTKCSVVQEDRKLLNWWIIFENIFLDREPWTLLYI